MRLKNIYHNIQLPCIFPAKRTQINPFPYICHNLLTFKILKLVLIIFVNLWCESRLYMWQYNGWPGPAGPLHQREQRGHHQPDHGDPDRVLPGTLLREPGLHRDPRVQRVGHHHRPHPQRHQPPRQDEDGPGAGTEEQRQQAAPRHHGIKNCVRPGECRGEDYLQLESKTADRGCVPRLPPGHARRGRG